MKLLRIALAFFGLLAFQPSDAVPIAVRLSSHGTICIEAEAFVARATALDNKHINAVNDFVCPLVRVGIWAKGDAIYLPATQNSTTALLNLKSSSFALTLTNSPTFTADRGFAANGTTSFADTGFNASTAGGSFTQNSASMGVLATVGGSNNVVDIGVAATETGGTYINSDSGGGLSLGTVNQAAVNDLSGNGGGLKVVIANRSASNANQLYWDGVSVATTATASQALANLTVYIGGAHNSTGLAFGSTKTIGFAWLGGSLSATEAMFLTQQVKQYMKAIGAAVCCG